MSDSTQELIGKLKAAEGPSRVLDREIMALTYRWEARHIGGTCWDDGDERCCPDGKHLDWGWIDQATDRWTTNANDGFEFTASLDRALALAERTLPGVRVMTERFHDGKGWAMVQPVPASAKIMTDGSTPALALCIAILKAQAEARV